MNIVRWRRAISKLILAVRHRKVVHFVVENDASGRDDELGAKKGVDCRGEGDGEAGMVGGGDIGGALAGDILVYGVSSEGRGGGD